MKMWQAMLVAVGCGVGVVASHMGLMGTAAFMISAAALHPSVAELSIAIVGVRFFGLARAVLRYAERYIAHDATFRLLGRLRVQFYQAVEPLVPSGLAGYQSGDVLSMMIADIETLQFFFLRVVAPPAVCLLIGSGVVLWLGTFDRILAGILLIGFICGGGLIPLILYRIEERQSGKYGAARGQLQALLADSIEGMPELAAFAQSERQAQRVRQSSRELGALQQRSAGIKALAEALGGLVVNGTLAALLVAMIPLVRQGRIAGVYMAVIVLTAQSSFEAVLPLALTAHYWRQCREAYQRLVTLARTRARVSDQGQCTAPDTFDIVFTDVAFGYNPAKPVLEQVNFALPAGRRVAIVGASGAGKSTLVSLLLRFWDCQGGVISIGGKDLKSFCPEVVRSWFSVVPQQAYLFHASILDNILLARPGAGREAVEQAVEKAGLAPFIATLPDGYNTIVGQSGQALSGGQRQRLAIARALLKDTPILILDEPAAGLDAVSEQELMQAVTPLVAGRTTLLITHRLVGLEAMDEILVLSNGRLVERGQQRELLDRKGLYYNMWQLQRQAIAIHGN